MTRASRPFAATFVRFAMMGGIGTAAQYLTLVALVHAAGIDAVLASSIGAIVGAIVNYLLNQHVTFRGQRSWKETGPRYVVVVAIGFVLNAAVMALLVHGLALNYLASQIIATGVTFVVNFLISHFWAFRAHDA